MDGWQKLAVGSRNGRRIRSKSGGIEGISPDLSGVAGRGNFFSVEQEADAGGIARSYHDLAAGAYGGVGGSDQSFTSHWIAVRRDRDPGGLVSPDRKSECGGSFRSKLVSGYGGWWRNGAGRSGSETRRGG